MSRIGKLKIEVPEGVNVSIEGKNVKVTGAKGELSYKLRPEINLEQSGSLLEVKPSAKSKMAASTYGLTRTLISNMIKGVSEGFEKQLEFHGVGYRAQVEDGNLVMHLGFSHPVKYEPKEGIEIKVEKNVITVSGISKEVVGQTAAEIRKLKKPEPYKGKGIRYVGEHVRRKAGKTAAKAAA